jgi:hypothetical protein
MANGYTIFFTYLLESTSGYSTGIHCNYIQNVVLEDVSNKEVNIVFNDVDDFKFLSSGTTVGTGYTVNKIYLIAQMIDNSTYSSLTAVKPIMGMWKKYDVTSQISGYFSDYVDGDVILPEYLVGSIFKFPTYQYYNEDVMTTYDLDYINYPSSVYNGTTESDKPLYFGDEQF